jgi:hypothetical protein
MPSRYAGTSVAGGVVTVSGIQGPSSSQRTWSSTHRHAASATAAQVSGVRAGIGRYSARGTTQLAVTGAPSQHGRMCPHRSQRECEVSQRILAPQLSQSMSSIAPILTRRAPPRTVPRGRRGP